MLMARGKGVVCLMQGSIVVRAHVGPAVGVDQRAIATTVGHAGAPHHINQNQNARSPVSTHTLEHEHCRRKEKQTSSEHCERQQNPRTQTNMQRAGGRRAKGGRASKRAHTYLLSGIVDMKDVAAAANMSPSKTDESDCDLWCVRRGGLGCDAEAPGTNDERAGCGTTNESLEYTSVVSTILTEAGRSCARAMILSPVYNVTRVAARASMYIELNMNGVGWRTLWWRINERKNERKSERERVRKRKKEEKQWKEREKNYEHDPHTHTHTHTHTKVSFETKSANNDRRKERTVE
jgi:hypothetical protein